MESVASVMFYLGNFESLKHNTSPAAPGLHCHGHVMKSFDGWFIERGRGSTISWLVQITASLSVGWIRSNCS